MVMCHALMKSRPFNRKKKGLFLLYYPKIDHHQDPMSSSLSHPYIVCVVVGAVTYALG